MEATTPKPAAPKAAPKKKQDKISNVKGISSAFIVILACAALAVCLFMFIMGDPANFSENDPVNGHPLNYLGTVYKGGFIVPILITLLFTVIVLSIERWIALSSAKGKGSVPKFVLNIKEDLAAGKIDQALARCKKQRGSVAAVVHAVLVKYKEMDANTVLSRNSLSSATRLKRLQLSRCLLSSRTSPSWLP